jgi:hypothetical protein
MFRYFNGALALAAAIGVVWILRLPNKEECRASGRTVDPTERHCDSATGFQQLEEHAWFHTREVAVGAALLWGGAYALHRRQRRRSASRATTA